MAGADEGADCPELHTVPVQIQRAQYVGRELGSFFVSHTQRGTFQQLPRGSERLCAQKPVYSSSFTPNGSKLDAVRMCLDKRAPAHHEQGS